MLSPYKASQSPLNLTAVATLAVTIAVIAVALAFEHLGGYAPCPLCLAQRYAYYAAIVLLGLALVLSGRSPRVAAFLFFAVALGFLANAALGVFHAGVEWKLWAGPDTCATAQALPTSAADLLRDAESTRVVRCDEAAWRLAGLSFAGWNVVMSMILFAGALRSAFFTAPKR